MDRTSRFIISGLTLFLFYNAGLAQQHKIDALLSALGMAKEDTVKIKTLNVLADKFIKTNDYNKAMLFADSARKLSEKIISTTDKVVACTAKKGRANAYNTMGIIYKNQGDYNTALEQYKISLKINEDLGDEYPHETAVKKGIANALNNIGIVYKEQGDYPKALEYHFRALKIREVMRQEDGHVGDKQGIATSLGNIGTVYYNQGDYAKALEQHFKSLKMKEQMGDKKGIAKSLNNIGLIYNDQGEKSASVPTKLAYFEKAILHYLKALKIMEEIGDKQSVSGLLNNIGNIYWNQGDLSTDISTRTGLYKNALEEHLQSLKIKEKMGDKDGIATSFINLGLVNIKLCNAQKLQAGKQKNFNEARRYLNDALLLSKKLGDKNLIKDSYQNLSTLDSVMGNWQNAYQGHKLYVIYRDSLINDENTKRTVRAQMNYDFDKKERAAKLEQERKDTISRTEKEKQALIRNFLIAGFLLVMMIALLILRSNNQKKRANKTLAEKNILIAEQKTLVEEKHKEITDGINYAERIQRSFLATGELLDENLRDHFVLFRPKDVVSGDFYWAGKLSNNNFALITADSTGHGVPGAIMSILNISSIEKAIETERLAEPAEILNHTRIKIIERLKKDGSPGGGKDGMDCSVISFDFVKNQFTYSAANNPVWMVRNKQLFEFAPDKMPVGKHDKDSVSFTQHKVDIEKGDVIYTITDGMPDQFGGPKGKKYMYKQLKEILISISILPMAEQRKNLITSFEAWKGPLEQVDDVTIIGVRV